MRKRRPAPSLYQDPVRESDLGSGRSKIGSPSGTIERGRPSSSRRDTKLLPSADGSTASPASTPDVASPASPAIGSALERGAEADNVATGEVVVVMTEPGPIASGRRATGAASGSPEARLVGATVIAGMSAPEPVAIEPVGDGELPSPTEPVVDGAGGEVGTGDGEPVALGRVEGEEEVLARTGAGALTRDTEGANGRTGAGTHETDARAGSPTLARAASERLGQRVDTPEGEDAEPEVATAGSADAAPYSTLAPLVVEAGDAPDAAPVPGEGEVNVTG